LDLPLAHRDAGRSESVHGSLVDASTAGDVHVGLPVFKPMWSAINFAVERVRAVILWVVARHPVSQDGIFRPREAAGGPRNHIRDCAVPELPSRL
jgi:hypothetical protein